GDALLRRQHLHVLVEARAVEEAPAALDVADEAVRLVLGADVDAADARIDAVGEREIDDAELAAEGHRGLGAPIRELLEARSAPARQHKRDRASGREPRELLVDAAAQRLLLVAGPFL